MNIVADNTTLGQHVIRCLFDPTKLTPGNINGTPTNQLFAPQIPEQTNSTTLTVRFLPRELIRHNHTNSSVDFTTVTLDSFVTFPNVNGNR